MENDTQHDVNVESFEFQLFCRLMITLKMDLILKLFEFIQNQIQTNKFCQHKFSFIKDDNRSFDFPLDLDDYTCE